MLHGVRNAKTGNMLLLYDSNTTVSSTSMNPNRGVIETAGENTMYDNVSKSLNLLLLIFSFQLPWQREWAMDSP